MPIFAKFKNYLKSSFEDVLVRPKENNAALDGLRALAILLVIGMHVNEYFFTYTRQTTFLSMLPPFKGGWVGVPLFFVLSGYLIGGQIWAELRKTGHLKIGRFILRRGFRIWPLYYFAIAFFIIFPGDTFFDGKGLLADLIFVSNFIVGNGPVRGGWSLATEEQFYIVAPVLILVLFKFFNLSFEQMKKVLWVMFFLPIVCRYFVWVSVSDINVFDLKLYMKVIYRPIVTNCEGLVIGLIISNMMSQPGGKKPASSALLSRPNLVLLVGAILMLVSFKSKLLFNFTGVAIGAASLVWIATNHQIWLTKVLSLKIFYPIAKLSFGIYLFHIPIMCFFIKYLMPFLQPINPALQMVIQYFIAVSASLIVCFLLYVLVEKPALMARRLFVQ